MFGSQWKLSLPLWRDYKTTYISFRTREDMREYLTNSIFAYMTVNKLGVSPHIFRQQVEKGILDQPLVAENGYEFEKRVSYVRHLRAHGSPLTDLPISASCLKPMISRSDRRKQNNRNHGYLAERQLPLPFFPELATYMKKTL